MLIDLRVTEFENIVKGTKKNPARNLNVDEIVRAQADS